MAFDKSHALQGQHDFWSGLSVISGSLCYNLIHGAWTDALVVGPPAQDWIRVASCPFPVH
jgi:hypothetical protein